MTTDRAALPRRDAADRRPRRRPARPDDPRREGRPARVGLVVRGRRRDGPRPGPAGGAGRRRHRPDHAAGRLDEPAADRGRRDRERDPALPRRGDPARDPGHHPRGMAPRPRRAGTRRASSSRSARRRASIPRSSRRWPRRSAGGCSRPGARHALAPVLDIARDPRWGRIEETYGEDPYLAAELGVRLRRGAPGPGPRRRRARDRQAHGRPRARRGRAQPGAGPPRRRASCATSSCSRSRRRSARRASRSVMPAYCDVDGVPCHASHELLDGDPARRVGLRRHRRLGLHGRRDALHRPPADRRPRRRSRGSRCPPASMPSCRGRSRTAGRCSRRSRTGGSTTRSSTPRWPGAADEVPARPVRASVRRRCRARPRSRCSPRTRRAPRAPWRSDRWCS